MTKDILPIPPIRNLAMDALQMAANRLIYHDDLEADVTLPRRMLKKTSDSGGHPYSFTAYVVACYARAIHLHPAVQAFRSLTGKFVIFHDVDVSTIIEHPYGRGIPIPTVIRQAQVKSVREITAQIRSVKADPHPLGRREGLLPWANRVPRPLRVLFFRLLKLNPEWIKRIDGTTMVSSFGMYGRGLRWGGGNPYIHTVGLWVGGVARKPMEYKRRNALRDCLHLTISLDHTLVDGAPASRFAATLVGMLESGAVLEEEAA
jgi:pyruvate/2-oxoglutarate dehydrogenase complex dihydrolipoamide acyltransferase (E2) component